MENRGDKQDYENFSGHVSTNFGKDWDKVSRIVDETWDYVKHIPQEAWKPMSRLATLTWEGWPRNFTKAVQELYKLWGNEVKFERTRIFCEHCNGHGVFSGKIMVEISKGKTMGYCHTWRCAGCRNWYGIYGEMIPTAWPLEIQRKGYEITVYEDIRESVADHGPTTIQGLIDAVGNRVNQKSSRPAIMPVRESFYEEYGDDNR